MDSQAAVLYIKTNFIRTIRFKLTKKSSQTKN